MATIRVDPKRIEDLAADIRSLRNEFDSLERRVDDYQPAVGHGRVVEQLEELASNWSDARDDILQRLDGLATACDGVARTYRDQEAHLSQQAQSVSGGS